MGWTAWHITQPLLHQAAVIAVVAEHQQALVHDVVSQLGASHAYPWLQFVPARHMTRASALRRRSGKMSW
jgi:hypothetical protein